MQNIPYIFGLPIFVWGGLIGMVFLIFQVLSGLRVIKVKPKTHKICGLILLGISVFHGLFGLVFFLA